MNSIIEEIKQKIAGIKPQKDDYFAKYFDVEETVKRVLKVLIELGLDKRKRSKILDISTCFGYVPYILQHFLHTVTYTDCINKDLVSPIKVREALGLTDCIDYKFGKVKGEYKHTRLPMKGKFNIITAIAVSPHTRFNALQWKLFIDDALSHLLKGGYLYVAPNRSEGMEALKSVLGDYKTEVVLKGWKIKK